MAAGAARPRNFARLSCGAQRGSACGAAHGRAWPDAAAIQLHRGGPGDLRIGVVQHVLAHARSSRGGDLPGAALLGGGNIIDDDDDD